MKIYRAVSNKERRDYRKDQLFRTAKNTLEAKQFFKSEISAQEFIKESRIRKFSPPYKYLFHIEIDEECVSKIDYDEQILDGYTAITIQESRLPAFDKCITLVIEHAI
jgi:hypothetical protein